MKRLALLLVPLVGLGAGASALAHQSATRADILALPGGCLRGVRVVVRFHPPSGQSLDLHVRTAGKELVHLTGVTRPASVTVRLPRAGGRIDVSGRRSDGSAISEGRSYRRCSPTVESPTSPPVTGGGEG
jgi:hypothetical protein